MHVVCAEMKFVLTGALLFSVLLCDAKKEFNTYTIPLTMKTSWMPKVVRRTCLLNPDRGPCRGTIMMYFYDPATQKCDTFDWGGCMGNGNRFATSAECNTTCVSQPNMRSKAPRWCQLTFDYGFCFGQVQRYYYDRLWRVCKPALYSGCGGNKNNFYSFDQCEQICRFGNEMLTTSKKKEGGTRKVLIINPTTTTIFDPTATTKSTIGPKF